MLAIADREIMCDILTYLFDIRQYTPISKILSPCHLGPVWRYLGALIPWAVHIIIRFKDKAFEVKWGHKCEARA
jgi:hypothetical protein